MRGEYDRICPVYSVVIPHPELLACLQVVGRHDGIAALVRALPVEHPQDDPAALARSQSSYRPAAERARSGQQVDPAL